MTSEVLHCAEYHRQHCTLQAFEQFGTLYMHTLDDKYSNRPDSNLVILSLETQADRMIYRGRPEKRVTIPKKRAVHPKLFHCWASVVDGGPTLNQHWVNGSC